MLSQGEVIKTHRLTKYYGKSRGIIDVSFEVKSGEVFGFIGPNGAGKTTTIRTLLNLIYPTSGEATIFGTPISVGGGKLYQQIGYVPTEVSYYPEMTGEELLDYAAGFYPEVHQRWTRSLVERLQFDPSKRIRSYSHGNRKKLGIIQALLHQPRLVILDEPTSGLDPLIKLELFHLLHELNEQGTTIFFSTHVLEEVGRICTRVGVIKDGRLIQVASIDELPGREMKIIIFKLAKGEAPGKALADWGHPAEVEGKPGYYQMTVQTPVNEIVARLATLDLDYLKITDPSIEELFLAMYEPEEKGGAEGV